MSFECVRNICKCIELYGIQTKPKDIALLAGLDFNSADDSTKMYYTKTIERLKHKEIFKEICKNYNY